MPTTRCYNCGLPGHQTQVCPRYGPRYPEPGKSSVDYVDEQQRIMNQIAADILAEHNHNPEERDEVEAEEQRTRKPANKWRPSIEFRRAIRGIACPVCDVEAGDACRSKTGKRVADSHRAREEAYFEAEHRRNALKPGGPVPDRGPGGPVRGPEGG